MNRNYCITSAVIFGLIALIHLWRLALGLSMQIGAWNVPRSASVIGAIVAIAMALWAVQGLRRSRPAAVVYT